MARSKIMGAGEDAAPSMVETCLITVDGEEYIQVTDGETVTLVRL